MPRCILTRFLSPSFSGRHIGSWDDVGLGHVMGLIDVIGLFAIAKAARIALGIEGDKAHAAQVLPAQIVQIFHRLPTCLSDGETLFEIEDDGSCRASSDGHLAHAGAGCRPVAIVSVQARANDWGIPQSARIFPGPATGADSASDVALTHPWPKN